MTDCTAPCAENYKYESLRGVFSIRLLDLLPPGENPDIIRATLSEHSLADLIKLPEYHCVSYRWEGKPIADSLFICGRRLPVLQNLCDFLHASRALYPGILLWADAICINQEDNEERSRQVALMAKTFSRARQVDIWLGQASEDSSAFFVWANNASTSSRIPEISMSSLQTARGILKQSYWYRAWIVQECVLARRLILHCGTSTLNWDHLVRIVMPQAMIRSSLHWADSDEKFPLNRHQHHRLGRMVHQAAVDELYQLRKLMEARIEMCPHWLASTNPILKRHMQDQALKTQLGFLHLLGRLRTVRCTDSLDRIYAFLPLTQTSYAQQCGFDKGTIPADYTIDFTTAAVRLLIAQDRTVSCHAWVIIKFLFGDLLDGTVEEKLRHEMFKREDVSNAFAKELWRAVRTSDVTIEQSLEALDIHWDFGEWWYKRIRKDWQYPKASGS